MNFVFAKILDTGKDVLSGGYLHFDGRNIAGVSIPCVYPPYKREGTTGFDPAVLS